MAIDYKNGYESFSEKSKNEEAFEKYLDEQIEQLAERFKASKISSVIVLYPLLFAIPFIVVNAIFFPNILHNLEDIIVDIMLIVAVTLIIIIYIFFFQKRRDAATQARSYLLDKLFELEKISLALEYISIAEGETKDHLKELLILRLLGVELTQENSPVELDVATTVPNSTHTFA